MQACVCNFSFACGTLFVMPCKGKVLRDAVNTILSAQEKSFDCRVVVGTAMCMCLCVCRKTTRSGLNGSAMRPISPTAPGGFVWHGKNLMQGQTCLFNPLRLASPAATLAGPKTERTPVKRTLHSPSLLFSHGVCSFCWCGRAASHLCSNCECRRRVDAGQVGVWAAAA